MHDVQQCSKQVDLPGRDLSTGPIESVCFALRSFERIVPTAATNGQQQIDGRGLKSSGRFDSEASPL